ncbi:hypothetical protein ABZZ79_03430 [Streptomyces sp. NPDC006458]|uniref:hypothetical protein n=1 Tax=Streptomyces sp. NPDC006458 TaxID=3154302 RepID=UPI0033A7CFC1
MNVMRGSDYRVTAHSQVSPHERRQAMQYVRRRARSAEDRQLLLTTLGLKTHTAKGDLMTRALPHDPYITAVCDALTAAGLELTGSSWTDDGESRGTYCYLNAVITLDPSGTHDTDDTDDEDLPAGTPWRHGLLLIWEWHTGIEEEDGEPARGPLWLFAELRADGSNEYPTTLPVYGYASPAAIVEATRKVISREIGAGHSFNGGTPTWDGQLIGDSWEQRAELDTACEAWGNDEASSG